MCGTYLLKHQTCNEIQAKILFIEKLQLQINLASSSCNEIQANHTSYAFNQRKNQNIFFLKIYRYQNYDE